MSSAKTSSEGQMGSGESDDEFYNVKLPNTPTVVSEYRDNNKNSVKETYSPPRTKVKYDYKFDSSSDDENEENSSLKRPESESMADGEKNKDESSSSDKKKLSQNTSKVVEKINEELKNMKNGSGNKTKFNKSDGIPVSTSTSKHIPASAVGVVPPVVVVPPPMIVPQSHSVMAMGPTGMIVPPTLGIGNQNVMIPATNMLNLSGNVIRSPNSVSGIMGTSGSNVVGLSNPSMIKQIQNQGNVVGMTNDILRLQGNLMGIAAPGNMMQLSGSMMNSPAVTGLCMTGNMIPMQGSIASMQGTCGIMGIQGASGNIMANQTIMNNQGNILGNASNLIANSGTVMMNPANVMTVTNLMNNQGSIMGNMSGVIGNTGTMMLNMNNLVGNQTGRMNYPGNVMSSAGSILNAQAMSSQLNAPGNRNATPNDKFPMNYTDKSSDQEGQMGSSFKSQSSPEKEKTTCKSPSNSPSDSDSRNWDGTADGDEDGNALENNKSHSSIKEIPNTFKNDGSFMELFKKMNEANNSKGSTNKGESSSTENNESESSNVKKPPVLLSGIVGKRRGGRVLKTGLVKKVKKLHETEEEKGPKDAWAMYMAEVKKYREASCEEEGKTRPLVK